MGTWRGEMSRVEIVEHDGDAPAGEAGASGGDRGARGGRRSRWARRAAGAVADAARRGGRRRWLLLLAPVVVVAVVLGGQQVVRDRDERTYLAGAVGLVAPVGASVGERWRATTGLSDSATWARVGDAFVGWDSTADDPLRAAAVDAATGAVRWTTPAWFAGRAVGPAGGALTLAPPTCAALGASRVVCLTGQLRILQDLGSGGWGPGDGTAQPRTAMVLDAGSGAILRRVPVGARAALVVQGASVVVAELAGDGHAHVSRHDPATWAEEWSYDGPAPAPATTPTEVDRRRVGADPGLGAGADGSVVVLGEGVPAVVLDRDGRVVRALAAGSGPASDGTSAVMSAGSDQVWAGTSAGHPVVAQQVFPGSGPATVLIDAATGRESTADGPDVLPGGDGTLGPVAVASAWSADTGLTHVTLLDLDDGTRWSAALPADAALGTSRVIRGLLVVSTRDGEPASDASGGGRPGTPGRDGAAAASPAALTAFDGRTGAVRWQSRPWRPPHDAVVSDLLTDGRSVLAAELSADGEGRVLTAHDVRDGRLLWSVPLPAGVMGIRAVGDQVVGTVADGTLVAIG